MFAQQITGNYSQLNIFREESEA